MGKGKNHNLKMNNCALTFDFWYFVQTREHKSRFIIFKLSNELDFELTPMDVQKYVYFSGSRMLHLLDILNVENVMVVVSRWYGGIQLGPDRFKVSSFNITSFDDNFKLLCHYKMKPFSSTCFN